MPFHHQVSYNSDSSLRPNEDNLLLILKLVSQKSKSRNAISLLFNPKEIFQKIIM
jgi:hypothetical protein